MKDTMEFLGVPARWRLPLQVLLGELRQQGREEPEIAIMESPHPGPLIVIEVSLVWQRFSVILFSDGRMQSYLNGVRRKTPDGLREHVEPAAQRYLGLHPKDPDYWVREAVRLAPRKPPPPRFLPGARNAVSVPAPSPASVSSPSAAPVQGSPRVGDRVVRERVPVGTRWRHAGSYQDWIALPEVYRDYVPREDGTGRLPASIGTADSTRAGEIVYTNPEAPCEIVALPITRPLAQCRPSTRVLVLPDSAIELLKGKRIGTVMEGSGARTWLQMDHPEPWALVDGLAPFSPHHVVLVLQEPA